MLAFLLFLPVRRGQRVQIKSTLIVKKPGADLPPWFCLKTRINRPGSHRIIVNKRFDRIDRSRLTSKTYLECSLL